MTTPLIGIEVDLETNPRGRRYSKCYESYFDAVVDAGGAPVLVPPCPVDRLRRIISRLDGIVVPGGDDFSAEDWGEEQRPCVRFVPSDPRRLGAGRHIVDVVLEAGRPFLGICYGMQLLNIALGGPLVQDIPDEVPDALEHKGEPHDLAIDEGTLLAQLVGGTHARINSRHHQSVREAGSGLRVCGRAPDGVVEAIEATDGRFLVGVQWHAEELGRDPAGLALFEGLVDAARRAALA